MVTVFLASKRSMPMTTIKTNHCESDRKKNNQFGFAMNFNTWAFVKVKGTTKIHKRTPTCSNRNCWLTRHSNRSLYHQSIQAELKFEQRIIFNYILLYEWHRVWFTIISMSKCNGLCNFMHLIRNQLNQFNHHGRLTLSCIIFKLQFRANKKKCLFVYSPKRSQSNGVQNRSRLRYKLYFAHATWTKPTSFAQQFSTSSIRLIVLTFRCETILRHCPVDVA